MENKKNLILFIVISAVIFGVWQFLYVIPYQEKQVALQKQQQAEQAAQQASTPATAPAPATAAGGAAPSAVAQPVELKSRAEALAANPRVPIETPRIKGSIDLRGGRLDDLVLKGYQETVDPTSPEVALLSPSGAPGAYFSEVGFIAGAGGAKVPDPDTLWQSDGGTLSPGHPVTLTWDNGAGLVFKRSFSVDENYLFTVTQTVDNKGSQPVELIPYSRVVRFGLPKDFAAGVVHEGAIAVLGGTLRGTGMFKNPWSYASIKSETADNPDKNKETTQGGWIGITDKYWLVAQIAPNDANETARAFYNPKYDSYQTDFTGTPLKIEAGASASAGYRVFAGVKEASLLTTYRDTENIPLFERSIDFGVYWFLTEPLQWFLTKVYHVVGNFGIAILCLTILVKLAMFPLANKSYMSMSKMKTLQPKMAELKEKYGDDKQRINTEMMALYKREKVNPAAGCLPMFVQIPVFYSLYKLFNITIEMRHAPFFGWIKDLSAPDPTSVLNLFGLIPWHPADYAHVAGIGLVITYLSIGIWPLVMGFTMWAQMRLNPTPPDPVQARMFQIMPIIFTFMLAHFAAGLVIYWAWNNTLSILQQRYIMRKLDKAKEQHQDKKAVGPSA
ncbi:MAG TPA: membrane protein insertase YidC [Dongiaceae bacterium]|nr:membrane protein insertase YidC [Dongiaceae bacterium]